MSELQTERSSFPLHMLLPTLSRGGFETGIIDMMTDGIERCQFLNAETFYERISDLKR